MYRPIGFKDLRVGQRVRLKGKLNEDGTFIALEIRVMEPGETSVIVGLIQRIHHHKYMLRIHNRDHSLPKTIAVKDLLCNNAHFADLAPESMVTLKGNYSPRRGFMPNQLKMKKTLGFNIDKLKGEIEEIKPDQRRLKILGYTVVVDKRTIIETMGNKAAIEHQERVINHERS